MAMRGGHETITSKPSSKRSRSSSAAPLHISDLPEGILLEIFSRVASPETVVRCKCVVKNWFKLLSTPQCISYVIGRTLYVNKQKQTPIKLSLINRNAKEIITTSTTKLSKSLCSEDRVVVATFNDLVLCCTKDSPDTYYISNPYTNQSCRLPHAPQTSKGFVPVGFICEPYYDKEKDQQTTPYYGKEKDKQVESTVGIIQHNAQYKYWVVRILPPSRFVSNIFQFKVEIFSSETGEWQASDVFCPRDITCKIVHNSSFAYNGKLYWPTLTPSHLVKSLFIGLDISMLNNNINNYICSLIEFPDHEVKCLGVCGGCLRMCSFNESTLTVWDLKNPDDMFVRAQHKKLDCYLDSKALGFGFVTETDLLAFDPTNEDIIYLHAEGKPIEWNTSTGEWNVRDAAYFQSFEDLCFLPLVVLPWWPTPVPRLP